MFPLWLQHRRLARPRLGRSPSGLRWGLLCIAGLALALQAAHAAFGLGGEALADANGPLLSVSVSAAAVAALLAATLAPTRPRRLSRLLIGAGIALYAAGEVNLLLISGRHTGFPTTSDFLWLPIYALALVGAVMVLRSEAPARRPRVMLEASIIGLAIAALGYELILEDAVSKVVASGSAGQLSYPVVDLFALTALMVFGIGNRSAMHANYLLLCLGITVLLTTDTITVHQLAAGTYHTGSLVESGTVAAILLAALSLQSRSPIVHPMVLVGWRYDALMTLAFLFSLTLFGINLVTDQSVVITVLTVPVLLLVVARLHLTIAANKRLSEDNTKIVATAGTGIVRLGVANRIVSINPAGARMLGWEQQDLIGRDCHATIHHKRVNGTPYPQSECPVLQATRTGEIQRVGDEVFWRKDGTSFPVDYTCSPIREQGRIVGAVLVFDDVTSQRQLETNLRYQADHDALTGLFNRRRFSKELDQQLLQAARYRRAGSLAIIDPDAFKFVNDSYGHTAGDRLLRQVASLLRQQVRKTDVIARLGGDEFAILFRETDPEDAMARLHRIIARIKLETAPTITISAGIAVFDGTQKLTGDDLLISADLALYEAKQTGGDRVVGFSGHKGQALTWVEQIREAIKEDRFVIYTQPIVDLKSGAVVREEILLRMRDEHGDIMPPGSFLPTAERFNLIGSIDRLVVEKGLRLAGEGRAVAINLSGPSLGDSEITEQIAAAVSAGLDPALVGFEITETSMIRNMEVAVEFANRLERLGCQLAIDDFGVGFGSFSYLRRLPLQVIKIDREFVRNLPENRSEYHMVRVLVDLAASLGQKTVAEGVEDALGVELLRRLGVDYAQGYFIGRPRAVELGNPREIEPGARAAMATTLHV